MTDKLTRDEDGLLPQERAFALEYLKDQNGTRAYLAAGYKAKNDNVAQACGSRMLSRDKVRGFIQKRIGEALQPLEADAERTIQEVVRLALLDPAEFFDEKGNLKALRDMSANARRAIAGFEVRKDADGHTVTKVRFIDKNAALSLLMRYHGLMAEDRKNEREPLRDIPEDVLDKRIRDTAAAAGVKLH
jgi:phage terminase small subunit